MRPSVVAGWRARQALPQRSPASGVSRRPSRGRRLSGRTTTGRAAAYGVQVIPERASGDGAPPIRLLFVCMGNI
jgi:hypothetical protein